LPDKIAPVDTENREVSEPDEDFAALFEASTQATRLEKGQTTEGTVVAIGPEVAFVNVGGKGEATIDIGELKNDDGVLEIAVGDRIEATVVSTAGGVVLSRRLALGAATARQLDDAFRAGLPVEGKVEQAVKGGYQVRIARQRAFCPMSQIDIVRTADPSVHEGRVYTFRIIEFGEDGRKFVVSRRALLEEEQRARAAEIRRSIAVGAVMTGRVVSVRDFGAFIDLGAGVQGLLHVSEMGWSRVADTSQFVTPGQEITVKVLRVDEATQQIALGLKQLSADPWSMVPTTYEVGQVRAGRVTRIAPFGAFVELEPGIEGLAHASTFAPAGRSGGWATSLTPGMTGAFEIISIEPEKKRIGVALVEEGSSRSEEVLNAGDTAKEASDEAGDTVREDAAPAQSFGSLADKLRGALTPRER
jgi:small subunit ribosomal protein S1